MKNRIIVLLLLTLALQSGKAQEFKRHTFTAGVISLDPHQGVYPDEPVQYYYSNYLNTFGYAYSFSKELKARIRFKKLDYVNYWEGTFGGETSTTDGHEIGIGGLYTIDLANRLSLYTGLEAVRGQSFTMGKIYSDTGTGESKIEYKRRVVGANIILGGEINVHPQFSAVFELAALVGQAKTTGIYSNLFANLKGRDTYLTPVNLLGINFKL